MKKWAYLYKQLNKRMGFYHIQNINRHNLMYTLSENIRIRNVDIEMFSMGVKTTQKSKKIKKIISQLHNFRTGSNFHIIFSDD